MIKLSYNDHPAVIVIGKAESFRQVSYDVHQAGGIIKHIRTLPDGSWRLTLAWLANRAWRQPKFKL